MRQEQFKIFCLALLCGLRKREIDTLLWRSVDFDKSVIRIERTEYFQPKSEDSAAEIDVAPELIAILRGFRATAKGEFVIESDNPPRYHTSRCILPGRKGIHRHLCLAGRQRFIRTEKASRITQGVRSRDCK